MSATNNISLKLSFNQVLEVVKQLPDNQKKKLLGVIKNNSSKQVGGNLSEKEKQFLEGLSESVEFVNNYKEGDGLSLNELLDEL